MVQHHGLRKFIISDWYSNFTANFWETLMNIMGVKLRMVTTHRTQADEET